MLKGDIDAFKQYSRCELIRFSGINETSGENTTNIVTNIVKSIDPCFIEGDIIRSHRVGQLKKTSFLSKTWTVDGKILMKDKSDRITVLRQTTLLRNISCRTFLRPLTSPIPLLLIPLIHQSPSCQTN